MRCFVAVDLEPVLREPLIGILRSFPLTRDVRWCTENQLHITLKFFGEVSDKRVPDLTAAVADASTRLDPFPIHLGRLGCFPSPRNPRILWCGIADPTGGCGRWLAAADPLFADLGFEKEKRAFMPHITLGRGKTSPGGDVIRDALAETKPPPPDDEMTVTGIVLFESRLRPSGAQYIPVATSPLGRP